MNLDSGVSYERTFPSPAAVLPRFAALAQVCPSIFAPLESFFLRFSRPSFPEGPIREFVTSISFSPRSRLFFSPLSLSCLVYTTGTQAERLH